MDKKYIYLIAIAGAIGGVVYFTRNAGASNPNPILYECPFCTTYLSPSTTDKAFLEHIIKHIGEHYGGTGEAGWVPEDIYFDGKIDILDITRVGVTNSMVTTYDRVEIICPQYPLDGECVSYDIYKVSFKKPQPYIKIYDMGTAPGQSTRDTVEAKSVVPLIISSYGIDGAIIIEYSTANTYDHTTINTLGIYTSEVPFNLTVPNDVGSILTITASYGNIKANYSIKEIVWENTKV